MNLTLFHQLISQNASIQEAYDSISIGTEGQHFIKGILHHTDRRDTIISGENLRIRYACIADAEFISHVEQDSDNSPWVANWNLGWRIQKFGDDDFLQTIIERKDGTPIGFAIFRDMLVKEQQVQLKRIALIEKGKGYGKDSLFLIQDFAFRTLHTARLYLSTKPENTRAQSVYKATGFIPETPDPCVNFHMGREHYIRNRQEAAQ